MATLVLTTVGGAIGGPIGAMLGGLIGQGVDRELFKPRGREGPRLNELKVQTSSYGTAIPKLFGTLRVAGSVIWATDLIEHRHREGGKGRPTTTSYSYSASFAVALSTRAIIGVGRIWADGKLLKGAAGDWKASTGFRLHHGGEDQAVDPLIASAEGLGATTAHRGIAYAVFEDLDLTDFGNRIPSLTFEVIADAGGVSAGEICAAISEGSVGPGEAATAIDGFSAYGETQRAVIEPLMRATGSWPRMAGDALNLMAGMGPTVEVVDTGQAGGRRREIATIDRVPRVLSLRHYDPVRDYQAGLQQAARPGAGNRQEAIELPAAMSAGVAKGLAQAMLSRAEIERQRRIVSTGWTALALQPGGRVTIAGEAGVWRVAEWSLEAMAVRLTLVPVQPMPVETRATSGRFLPPGDAVAGDTVVHAFELPPLGDAVLSTPRLSIAACGTGSGWRRATLSLSIDGGVRWEPAGMTAAPATIGSVETPAGRASAGIEDRRSALIVTLLHGGMQLQDADIAALDRGANLAFVGDELLQFGRAEPLGGNRWRLSQLWRGRRGSEAAIGQGMSGDRFILLEPGTLTQVDLADRGESVRIMAVAAASSAGIETMAVMNGRSILPPSPVHLAAAVQPDGPAMLRWTRRSRKGWRWIDGVDAPIGEEQERYQVRLIGPDGSVEQIETEVPSLVVSVERRARPLTVEVRQVGDHGLSPPASILLSAIEEFAR